MDKKTIADKNRKCTVCGNTTWFDEPVAEEECRDFHYHIRPSTALLLQQRKVGLGTWDSCIRQLIQGYDAYAAIVERQRFKWITGLKTIQGENMEVGGT